jgi:hypothetical protein
MHLFTQPLLYLVLSTVLLSASCKKNKSEQEKNETVTINGKTFGCRVDGELFLPDKWDYGNNIPPIDISFSRTTYGGVTLIVSGKKENETIQIFLNKPLVQGELALNEYTKPYPVWDPPKNSANYSISSPRRDYITSNASIGKINLLVIDTANFKVEARFEFIGTDVNTGKQVKVTNGYFKNF